MATKKQIEANRLNARKSTGPRTEEGKARSSMNALRTGIDARSQVIYGEYEKVLESLTAEYYARFHPTTPEQRMLVDTLIDSEWLLRRFRKAEARIWTYGANKAVPPLADTNLGEAFILTAEPLARLQRRIDMAQRNYRNALHELERLQAAEYSPDSPPEQESVPEAVPASDKNQRTKPEIGFVPPIPSGRPVAAPVSPARHKASPIDAAAS